MADNQHALRDCAPGYVAAALALGIIDPSLPITACVVQKQGATVAHSDPACASSTTPLPTVTRTAAEHAAADETPCDICDDWNPTHLSKDDVEVVYSLADWARALKNTRLFDDNPHWAGGPDNPTSTWTRAVRAISRLRKVNGNAAAQLRTLLLDSLRRMDSLEHVQTERAHYLLTTWAEDPLLGKGRPQVAKNALGDLADPVTKHAEAFTNVVYGGTDKQNRDWLERLNRDWVWVSTFSLGYDDVAATLVPDEASCRSGMVRLPTAALWHTASHCKPVPGFVPAADVETDADIHAAAQLANGDATRVPYFVAALAAART